MFLFTNGFGLDCKPTETELNLLIGVDISKAKLIKLASSATAKLGKTPKPTEVNEDSNSHI